MLVKSILYIIYLVASIAKVSSIAVKNTTFNRYTEIYFGVPIYKAIFAVGKKTNFSFCNFSFISYLLEC